MTDKHSKDSYLRIGVFSDWFAGVYQSELLSGIEHEAGRNGIRVFYFVGRSLNATRPYDNNYNVVYDAALDASLDGLVLIPMLASFCTADQMSVFVSRYAPVPLVTMNFKTDYGNAILSNNALGFRTLLDHLTEDHGYGKLAFVNGPEKNIDAIERSGIYESGLASHGIPLDPSLVTAGNFTYLSGKEAISAYLDQRGLVPGRDMEVIVCANDQMAWGALNELESRGFRIPGDIAITGFDDIRSSTFPIPAFTTVRQHVHEMGRAAISDLLSYGTGRKETIFDTELVVRGSCGCKVRDTVAGRNTKNYGMADEAGKPDSAPGTSVTGPHASRKDKEMLLYRIIETLDTLKLLVNTGELNEWLRRRLPFLGIESAYLLLYSGSPVPSRSVRLIAGYDRRRNNTFDLQTTLSLHSVFGDILSGTERRSYCIFPLLFENEQYGLLAAEVNIDVSFVYDTLNSPIANSIKSMLLMEEVSAMNLKLEEANSLLQRANEQKTQFFINVAHETKTPLTLIQNYLAQCMARFESDPDLAVVKQNIDILLENMLNFLDAERLEKGTMSYAHDAFMDLSESARKKCVLFEAVAAKKSISIGLNVEDDIVVKIDPWALDRILNNLLDNAIKYTQTGGSVSIEVSRAKDKAVLRVSDNGPGLSGDTIAHLFEPYYQLSKKRSNKQGIGVGLSIVKKIVDDLGASIAVTNENGGGACFTIAFNESRNASGARHLRDIPLTAPSAGIIAGDDIGEDEISPDKTSILVVDDNVQMLNFLKASLGKTYNVFVATSVKRALAKLRLIERPELIISDIMMDGLDGHALLAALSGTDEYSDVPFIFLSAASSRNEELRGLGGGAIDYITKPFSIAELEKKIESIIALRSRMKKREMTKIRKGIDGLLSNIENGEKRKTEATFDSLCTGYGISNREKKILALLLNGYINKEIAFRLHLSLRAVEYHITKIFKKAGVTKRFDLVSKFKV